MRTCAAGAIAKAVNHPADAAAPMNPAKREMRQAARTLRTVCASRMSSQPPRSKVCRTWAATSVNAADMRNGTPGSASVAPR